MIAQKFIREWVKDLRSGRYSQTQGHLCDRTGYCCLGVACLTAERLGLKVEDGWRDNAEKGFYFKNLEGVTFNTANDEGYDPVVPRGACSELNDNEGLTFNEIADEIEENLLFP